MMTRVLTITALTVALGLAGCSNDKSESNSKTTQAQPTQQQKPAQPATPTQKPAQPATPTQKPAAGGQDPAMAKAKQLFQQQCAMCHGPEGKGNGPAAANLPTKPRNYSDPAWQKSVTDERIKQVIVQGGQASGLSAIMPANPHLANMPGVLDAMVKLIRSFGQQQ